MEGRTAEWRHRQKTRTRRRKEWTHCTTVEWDAKQEPDCVDRRKRETWSGMGPEWSQRHTNKGEEEQDEMNKEGVLTDMTTR